MILNQDGSSLLDGRGGSESVSGRGGSGFTSETGHRYIYYRLYTKDGVLTSNNPVHSNDQFISRISAKSIAPPRTTASLKKHLFRIEGFDNDTTSTLYLSLSDKLPAEDSTRLALRGSVGQGSSELDPVALVVGVPAVEKRSGTVSEVDFKTLNEWPQNRRYVHYRLYDEGGEITSKTTFDATDSALGRIDTLSIPPPHTIASLKARLIQAEGISGHGFQLFQDDDGETILNDDVTIALLGDSHPGISEDEPIAIVYEQRRNVGGPYPPGFSKQLRANQESAMGAHDSAWHSSVLGEIFQTDGVLRKERYFSDAWSKYECYEAINSSGKRAFINSGFAALC